MMRVARFVVAGVGAFGVGVAMGALAITWAATEAGHAMDGIP